MKKFIALLIAFILIFSLTACGNRKNKDSLSICLATEPTIIDPALNSSADGATILSHLFAGLAKWTENENGEVVITADAAEELTEGVVNPDGTVTYIYKLRKGAAWSDGKALAASDFVYAWNRAASPELSGDYNYMFDVIVGYDEMWESDKSGNYKNPDARLAVRALDKSTLEVTLTGVVTYWNELLAFPAYYPVRKDALYDKTTDASAFISNGAYKLDSLEHNNVMVLTKNDKFYDADIVTMPELRFYFTDNANTMLDNFKNGQWHFIDNIPSNELGTLKETYNSELSITEQLGTYFICWNVNETILPEGYDADGVEEEKAMSEIRKAISLLIDRNYIVNAITKGSETPASTFVPKGLSNHDGTQFYHEAGVSTDYFGYFNVADDDEVFAENYASAIKTLKKYYTLNEESGKFTDIPEITYICNKGDIHLAIAEYIKGALSVIGIEINIIEQEWDSFVETRKKGDYTFARNGWLADYNYPVSFLDMWTTASGNNDIQFGSGSHKNLAIYSLDLTPYGIDIKVEKGTWAETYDVLLSEIKESDDPEVCFELMHLAEDILMETGCIMPLYYYTDVFMINSKVQGFYCNPLGYKYFMQCRLTE